MCPNLKDEQVNKFKPKTATYMSIEKNKSWVMKNKVKQTKRLITSNMSNKKNKA